MLAPLGTRSEHVDPFSVCIQFSLWGNIMKSIYTALAVSLASSTALAAPLEPFQELTLERGNGSGLNAYGWSTGTLYNDNSAQEDLFVGTFNINFDWKAVETYLGQILPDPGNPSLLTVGDAFRRIWSGSPITKTSGGEIWRFDGHKWYLEHKAGQDGPTDEDTPGDLDVGYRSMVNFGGTLYAGSANGPDGPKPTDPVYDQTTVTYDDDDGANIMMRQADGTWMEVEGGPSSDRFNASIRTMIEADGKLWVGTENPITGPQLWSYDGTTWTKEASLDPGDLAIGELAYIDGHIVVGTWASRNQTSFELLKLDNGSLVSITPTNPGLASGSGVMEIREFEGQTYLGVLDYLGGFKLVHTDDPFAESATWNEITLDGFGNFGEPGGPSNAYPWSSIVINDVYYIGTFSTNREGTLLEEILGVDVPLDGRAQIWYSDDGKNWKILEDDAYDTVFTYGIRSMTEWRGDLTVATASNLFVPDLFSEPYFDLPDDFMNMSSEQFALWFQQEYPSMSALFATEYSSEEIAQTFSFLGGRGDYGDGLLPYKGFQVYSATPVPLPPSVALLGSTLLAGAWYGRRRKRQS